jgi:hypothetical protein
VALEPFVEVALVAWVEAPSWDEYLEEVYWFADLHWEAGLYYLLPMVAAQEVQPFLPQSTLAAAFLHLHQTAHLKPQISISMTDPTLNIPAIPYTLQGSQSSTILLVYHHISLSL